MTKHFLFFFLFLTPASLSFAQSASYRCDGDTCLVIIPDKAPIKRLVRMVHHPDKRNILVSAGKRSYGFCSADGKIIIPSVYDAAQPFKNGYALVRKDSLRGIIDSTGRLIIPIKYTALSEISEGAAFFSKSNKLDGVVDLKGKEYPLDPKMGTLFVAKSSMTNIPADSLRIFLEWNNQVDYHFSEGLAIIGSKVVDIHGKYIFSSLYIIHDCKEGMLKLERQGPLFGFADKTGKVVIQPIYHSATDFKNGKAKVTTGNPKYPVWKIIDKTGAEVK